jgi:hypothetical protein
MFIYFIIACEKIQKFQKEIKRTLEKHEGKIALLLMLLVSGLSIKGSRCGGW